jgi:hypothetical protein
MRVGMTASVTTEFTAGQCCAQRCTQAVNPTRHPD